MVSVDDSRPESKRKASDDDETSTADETPAMKRPNLGVVNVHDGAVTVLAYSADGKYLASGSEDAMVFVWNVPNHTRLHTVALGGGLGHTDMISALAFSRDNIYLASASVDKLIIIWTVENGQEYKRITAEDNSLTTDSLAYTPDDKYLVVGTENGTLQLWEKEEKEEKNEPVQTLHGNSGAVTFIIFSSDGRLMATGGTDRVCCIWDTTSLLAGEPPTKLQGHNGMVCAAAFSPSSIEGIQRIVTASYDGSSRIWNALTGDLLITSHGHNGQVYTVAFSPDGKRVASGSNDSTVKVYDSYTGDALLTLDGHGQGRVVNTVEFSPDGQHIMSAASDGTVQLWKVSDGTKQKTYNEHRASVTMAVFAPDGLTLASGSQDGTVVIRTVRTS